jgi:hypothetical protein
VNPAIGKMGGMHAPKLIDKGGARQYVTAFLDVSRLPPTGRLPTEHKTHETARAKVIPFRHERSVVSFR